MAAIRSLAVSGDCSRASDSAAAIPSGVPLASVASQRRSVMAETFLPPASKSRARRARAAASSRPCFAFCAAVTAFSAMRSDPAASPPLSSACAARTKSRALVPRAKYAAASANGPASAAASAR